MIKEGKAPIVGDGESRRSMSYVDNTSLGLLLAAERRGAAGETYWIADERAVLDERDRGHRGEPARE